MSGKVRKYDTGANVTYIHLQPKPKKKKLEETIPAQARPPFTKGTPARNTPLPFSCAILHTRYLAAVRLEEPVVFRVHAPHGVRHFAREPNRRGHRLGIPAENIPEVDVEQIARR